MNDILKRLNEIELKLDAILYLLTAEEEEMPSGDEFGLERDSTKTL